MWFDAHAKLAEIAGAPPATPATSATKQAAPLPRVASVASVATPPKPKSEPAPVGADGLETDAAVYLGFLKEHGPQSYGAVARALGWGATRAWQAEARLRATGRIRHHDNGMSEAK